MGKNTNPTNPTALISEMRSIGESMYNRGMIEFDLSTGEVSWCNEYALSQIGYEPHGAWSASIFNFIPDEFHSQLKKHISNATMSRGMGISIWPTKTTSGAIAWWYVYQSKIVYPLKWSYLEFIQTTDAHGVAYAFMRMQMDTMHKYGDLSTRVNELDKWIREKISELSEKDTELEHSVEEMRELTESLINTKNSIESFKEELKRQYNELDKKTDAHTTEILKLISSNVTQAKRMSAFEHHVKMTTDLAIKSIAMQTEKVGKGLPKKIAIPVSIVSIIAAVVQYIIQNWVQNGIVWPF